MQNVVFDQECDEKHPPSPERSNSERVPEEGQSKADEDEGNAKILQNDAYKVAQPGRRTCAHGDPPRPEDDNPVRVPRLDNPAREEVFVRLGMTRLRT